MLDHITLAVLANELGMDRSALRKAVLKMGLSTMRVRSMETRGQATLAVRTADAATVRKHYAWRLTEG